MNKKIWPLGAVAAAVIAAATWWQLGEHTPKAALAEAPATAPPSVKGSDTLHYAAGSPQLAMIATTALASSRVPLTDALTGRLVYDEDVTARLSVNVSGRIVAIHAAPGDRVKAGMALAEIDTPDLGTATADLNKARADEQRKAQAVERARALVPGDAIAVKDFESLQADLALAHAETERAAQRVKNLNPRGTALRGQNWSLLSPLDGIVTDRTATPALEVNPGMATPLFVVTDPRRLWLMIDVPETVATRIRRGAAVSVASDAYPGETFNARVAQSGQVVDVNTRRVTLRAQVENPQGKLLPEMFVRAQVLQDSGAGVRVPNTALVNQGLNTYVFVQSAAGDFTRRQVKLLTQGAEASFVGDGLNGGEQVVTTGALLLDAELAARQGGRQ